MSIRVDNQGYLLNFNTGERLSEGNDPASVQKRFQLIIEEWKKNHPTEVSGPRDGTTIILVERGDSQWKIAETAGADPVTTYTQLNAQFKNNPDLIHPNQIVFVAPTTEFVADPETGRNNVDLFRDNLAGRSDYAEGWENGDRVPLGGGNQAHQGGGDPWASISRDSRSFLESLAPYGYNPAFVHNVIAPGDDHAWGENGYGRQLFLGHYMDLVPDPGARTQMIVDGGFDDTGLMGQLGRARGVDPATLQPTGTEQTVHYGPAIARYAELPGSGDNRGGFQHQFQDVATNITEYPPNINLGSSTPYYNPPNIDFVENAWLGLENHTKTYMSTIGDEQKRFELVDSLLHDPTATSRSRQAAVAGYLQTFAKGEARNAEATRLSTAFPEFRQDIDAASQRVKDR